MDNVGDILEYDDDPVLGSVDGIGDIVLLSTDDGSQDGVVLGITYDTVLGSNKGVDDSDAP